MEQCDTLLMAGTSFPYMEFHPRHDRCRGVQIDRDHGLGKGSEFVVRLPAVMEDCAHVIKPVDFVQLTDLLDRLLARDRAS